MPGVDPTTKRQINEQPVAAADSPELWDLLDLNGHPTGRTAQRAEGGADPQSLLRPGDWHRVVQVCAFNSRGHMLIQLRAAGKVDWPNAWDLTAGGSVLAGETSQAGARRELLEELGVDHDFSHSRPDAVISFPQGFFDVYTIDLDDNLTGLTLQPEEVRAVRWASLSEIQAMMANQIFCGLPQGLVELIFALHAEPNYLWSPTPGRTSAD